MANGTKIQKPKAQEKKTETGKLEEWQKITVMNYIASLFLGFIPGVAVYLMYKDDEKIRYHGLQSALLTIIIAVVMLISVVTIIGPFVLVFVYCGVLIFIAYKIYKGEDYRIKQLEELIHKFL